MTDARNRQPGQEDRGPDGGHAACICGTAGGRTDTPTVPTMEPDTRSASTAASSETSRSDWAPLAERPRHSSTMKRQRSTRVVPAWSTRSRVVVTYGRQNG